MTTVDPLGYGATSFWLETCDDDLTPRPQLDGSADADVAILGAGYTGLWTAYELLRREPGLKVTLARARDRRVRGLGSERRLVRRRSPGLVGQPRAAVRARRHDGDRGRRRQRGRRDRAVLRGRADRRRLRQGRQPRRRPRPEPAAGARGPLGGYRRSRPGGPLREARRGRRRRAGPVEGALGAVFGTQYAVDAPRAAGPRPGPGGRAPGRDDPRADRGDRRRAGRGERAAPAGAADPSGASSVPRRSSWPARPT